ncbi:MAG: O-antigen ligase family protein [Patescibacteria group bacterium]
MVNYFKKIRLNFEKLSIWCLLATVLLLPLIFDIRTYNVFEVVKVSCLNLGVELALILYLLYKLFQNNTIKLCQRDLTAFFKQPINLAVTFMMVVQILATYFSIFRPVSIWGLYERWQGLFTWLHIYIFYYLCFILFDRNIIRKLLLGLTIVTTIVAGYAMLQHWGVDLPGFERGYRVATSDFSIRSFSTLGHPNFLGMYLVMVLPLIVYSFTNYKSLWSKSLVVVGSMVSVIAIVFTLARSAWLALIAVVVFTVVVIAIKHGYKFIFNKLSIKKLLLILLLVIMIFFSVNWVGVSSRLNNSLDLQNNSLGVRLWVWQIAIDAWQQRPVLGFGPETFYILSQNHPSPFVIEPNLFDRSHNIYLDFMVTGGSLLLLGFLLIIILFIKQLYQKLKTSTGNQFFFYLSIIASLISYLLMGFFNFDNIVSLVFLFLLIAIFFRFEIDTNNNYSYNYLKKIWAMIIILIIFLWPVIHNINIWRADISEKKGEVSLLSNKIDQAESYFIKVTNLNGNEPNYSAAVGKTKLIKAMSTQDVNGLWASAQWYNKSRTQGLADPVYYQEMITLLSIWSSVDNAQLPVLLNLFAKGERSLANKPEFYLAWGKVMYSIGDLPGAKDKFTKYLNLNNGKYSDEIKELLINLNLIND